MKYEVYLVAWDKVLQNVQQIQTDLVDAGIPFKVVSSCSDAVDGWINLGKNAWATQQLYAAVSEAVNSDLDYMFLLYGDAVAKNGSMSKTITESIDRLQKLPDCAVYTTAIEHNHWGTPNTIIDEYGDGVFYICATDLTYVAFDKSTYTMLYEFMNNLRKKCPLNTLKSSWGFDNLAWVHSILEKKNMFRDTNLIILHDISETGYDNTAAFKELYFTLNHGYAFLMERLNVKPEEIVRLKTMFDEQYFNRVHSREDFYA